MVFNEMAHRVRLYLHVRSANVGTCLGMSQSPIVRPAQLLLPDASCKTCSCMPYCTWFRLGSQHPHMVQWLQSIMRLLGHGSCSQSVLRSLCLHEGAAACLAGRHCEHSCSRPGFTQCQ